MYGIEAIVISEDHYNALGLIRSLGCEGIPVHLILTSLNKSFCDKSRYVTDTIKVNKNDYEILTAINDCSSDEKTQYALFPLSDYSAQLIDKNRLDFKNNMIVPHMNGKMSEISDKFKMKEWAKCHGLLVPEGIVIQLSDLNLMSWSKYPAILKPIISVEGLKSDIKKVENEAELLQQLEELSIKGYKRVLLEEFICGNNEHMVEVLGERTVKHCHFSDIISKIREYPIANGSTSYARIVKKHDGLDLNILRRMLESIEFIGLFDFEFKYSDGKLYFIECNFRNGAPGWALTKYGCNLPLLWISHTNDITLVNTKLVKKDTFMCEQNDIINMLKREVSVCSWFKEFLSSYKVFWDIRDIKPVICYYWQFILSRF